MQFFTVFIVPQHTPTPSPSLAGADAEGGLWGCNPPKAAPHNCFLSLSRCLSHTTVTMIADRTNTYTTNTHQGYYNSVSNDISAAAGSSFGLRYLSFVTTCGCGSNNAQTSSANKLPNDNRH